LDLLGALAHAHCTKTSLDPAAETRRVIHDNSQAWCAAAIIVWADARLPGVQRYQWANTTQPRPVLAEALYAPRKGCAQSTMFMIRASQNSMHAHWPGKAGGSGATISRVPRHAAVEKERLSASNKQQAASNKADLPRGAVAPRPGTIFSLLPCLALPGLCMDKGPWHSREMVSHGKMTTFYRTHSQRAVMTVMQGLCIAILVAQLLAPNPD
jgi:hypothetical protein